MLFTAYSADSTLVHITLSEMLSRGVMSRYLLQAARTEQSERAMKIFFFIRPPD